MIKKELCYICQEDLTYCKSIGGHPKGDSVYHGDNSLLMEFIKFMWKPFITVLIIMILFLLFISNVNAVLYNVTINANGTNTDIMTGKHTTGDLRRNCQVFTIPDNNAQIVNISLKLGTYLGTARPFIFTIRKNDVSSSNLSSNSYQAGSLANGINIFNVSSLSVTQNADYMFCFEPDNFGAFANDNFFPMVAQNSDVYKGNELYYYSGSYNNMSYDLYSTVFYTVTVADTTPPTISYIQQTPAQITSSNLIGNNLNITYSITDDTAIDNTKVYMNVSVENSNQNITYYQNGTTINAQQKYGYTELKNTSNYIWSLDENQLYFGTYLFNETLMESTTKKSFDCGSNNCQYQLQVVNFTNKSINIFEIGLDNETNNLKPIKIGICNQYDIVSPDTSPNCTILLNDIKFPNYHSHKSGVSNHSTFSFTFNTSEQRVNGLFLRQENWFYVSITNNGVNKWSVNYRDGRSRDNAFRYLNGTSFNSLNMTFDYHLHQLNENETKLFYKVYATDTNSNQQNGTERTQYITTSYLNPDNPFFYTPNTTNIFINENYLYISWNLPSSPLHFPFGSFNINVTFQNGSNYNIYSSSNTSTVFNFYNNANLTDVYLRLRYCDLYDYCSYASSINFTMLYYTLPISDNALLMSINESNQLIVNSNNNIYGVLKMLGIIFFAICLLCIGIFTEYKYFISLSGLVFVLMIVMSSSFFEFWAYLIISFILIVLGIGIQFDSINKKKSEKNFYEMFDKD
jgi:hypothetical protein